MSNTARRACAIWAGCAVLTGAIGGCGSMGDLLFGSGGTSTGSGTGTGGHGGGTGVTSTVTSAVGTGGGGASTTASTSTSTGTGMGGGAGTGTSSGTGVGGGTGGGATGTGTGTGTGGTGGAPAVCGDAIINGTEECDGLNLGGKTCKDYGFSSPDGLFCKFDCTLSPSNCKATCDGALLEPGELCDGTFLNGKSCTDYGFGNPAGLACANCQFDASGCKAACGNNVLEVGEKCDGMKLGGKSCSDFGYVNMMGLACAPGCQGWDTAGCTSTCNNGMLEPGEVCDGLNIGNHSCLEFSYANAAGLTCTNCMLNATTCKAVCGNNQLEPTEVCDGANLNGHTCTDVGFVNPAGVKCTGCMLDGSGCKAACNGTLEPGEVCDGNNLNGHTCTEAGFVNPAGMKCTNCAVDASGCKPTCGNGVLEPTELCDGANLNGKTCKDYGFVNPGGVQCTNACMPTPIGCKAVCGNNVIEPGEQCDDGNLVSGDGCSATCKAEGNVGLTCATALPVALQLGTTVVNGNTAGGGAHKSSLCNSDAPDRIYAVTAGAAGFLTASLKRTASGYDSVLYASPNCSDANPIAGGLCADSKDAVNPANVLNGGEVLSGPVAAGQTIYVFVDGAKGTAVGPYQLVLNLAVGSDCNDPIVIPLEPGTPMTFIGSTVNEGYSTGGSCGGMSGPDVVYKITRSNTAPVTVYADPALTNYNSVLYARVTCNDPNSEAKCSYMPGNGGEFLNLLGPQANVPFYVWVDGTVLNGGTPQGNYGLVVTP